MDVILGGTVQCGTLSVSMAGCPPCEELSAAQGLHLGRLRWPWMCYACVYICAMHVACVHVLCAHTCMCWVYMHTCTHVLCTHACIYGLCMHALCIYYVCIMHLLCTHYTFTHACTCMLCVHVLCVCTCACMCVCVDTQANIWNPYVKFAYTCCKAASGCTVVWTVTLRPRLL